MLPNFSFDLFGMSPVRRGIDAIKKNTNCNFSSHADDLEQIDPSQPSLDILKKTIKGPRSDLN
jgi:hypothetical protein